MPIICLEGASAVGKTTTAQLLAAEYRAAVVPEVNALFARPTPEPATWYLERQVERWMLARKLARTHPLVVLDGDVLQPLWYNWIYPAYAPQAALAQQFYRQQFQRGTLAFPDLYVLLTAPIEQLRQHKAADLTRSRRHFEQHLQLVEPQRLYFQALAQMQPGLVLPLQARQGESSANGIVSAVTSRRKANPNRPGPMPDDQLLNCLLTWLSQHEP